MGSISFSNSIKPPSDVGLVNGGRGKYGKVGMGWIDPVQGKARS